MSEAFEKSTLNSLKKILGLKDTVIKSTAQNYWYYVYVGGQEVFNIYKTGDKFYLKINGKEIRNWNWDSLEALFKETQEASYQKGVVQVVKKEEQEITDFLAGFLKDAHTLG